MGVYHYGVVLGVDPRDGQTRVFETKPDDSDPGIASRTVSTLDEFSSGRVTILERLPLSATQEDRRAVVGRVVEMCKETVPYDVTGRDGPAHDIPELRGFVKVGIRRPEWLDWRTILLKGRRSVAPPPTVRLLATDKSECSATEDGSKKEAPLKPPTRTDPNPFFQASLRLHRRGLGRQSWRAFARKSSSAEMQARSR